MPYKKGLDISWGKGVGLRDLKKKKLQLAVKIVKSPSESSPLLGSTDNVYRCRQPSLAAEFIRSQRERSAKVIFFYEVVHLKDRIKIQLTSTRTSTITIHEMTNWNFQFENGQTHL